MNAFVLSVIGADRAGLVAALSEVVAEHGGSWERSQLTELAGHFAGMVLVHVPEERTDDFRAALEPLHEQGLLDVDVRPATAADVAPEGPTVSIEVVGADRPGIVHEVSTILARIGAGIVDLRTTTESASMAGTPLFRAEATVRLPADVTPEGLAGAFEALSDDLMVDLDDHG